MTVSLLALPWHAVAGTRDHTDDKHEPSFSHRAFSLHTSMDSLHAFVAEREAKGWRAPDGKKECSLQFKPAASPIYDGHIPLHEIEVQKSDTLVAITRARPNGVMVHTEFRKKAWYDMLAQSGIEEPVSFGSAAATLYSVGQMALMRPRITVLDATSLQPLTKPLDP